MASAPQSSLPLFYNDLMPINSRDHGTWKTRPMESANFLKGQHAVPVTVDEFVQAQRNLPIIFSSGDEPVPLALMGLNEGVNVFVDDNGKVNEPVYLPAYVRRYPYMLARLREDADELSLCFDPTSEALGAFSEGDPLFSEDGQASEWTKQILDFCEQFEQAGQRTKAFMDELLEHKLLMDGEIAISTGEQPDQTFTYRGFQMIDQEKLKEVGAAQLETWTKSGFLMLAYAHIFSLDQMRNIFGRQVQMGKGPQNLAPAPAPETAAN